MLRAVGHAFPLAPLAFGAVLLASVAAVRHDTGRSRLYRWAMGAWVAAVGSFMAATLTPTAGIGSRRWTLETYAHLIRSMSFTIPDPRELVGANDTSFNVLIGIPLGLVSVLLARVAHRWWPLWSVVVLPFVCEFIQAAVPPLGRVGFVLADAVNNEFGVALGLVAGAAAVWGLRLVSGVGRRGGVLLRRSGRASTRRHTR